MENLGSARTELQHLFTRKREEIKRLLYRYNPDECPDTLSLVGTLIPLPADRRHGKIMLKKVWGGMAAKFGKNVEIVATSQELAAPELVVLGLVSGPALTPHISVTR